MKKSIVAACIIALVSCQSKETKEEYTSIVEERFSIPDTFSKNYELIAEEDISWDDSEVNRRDFKILIPPGLSISEVDNNIKTVMLDYIKKEGKADIWVSVYKDAEAENRVATGSFAPEDRWEEVEKEYPIRDYELNFNHDDLAYFNPELKEEVNREVYLFRDTMWNRAKKEFTPATVVPISNSAREWMDENIIVEVPNNAKAEVIEVYREKITGGSEIVRYKVNAVHNGKTYEGWVHSEEIKDDKQG